MGKPLRRGRATKREQVEGINRAFRMWGVAFGKPEVAEQFVQPLPPKRERTPRAVDTPSDVPLEREVLASVLKALRHDPRVAYVWRQSSGVFKEGERYISTGPVGMPDVLGFLRGGKFFAIEVKRPGKEPSPVQRELLALFKTLGAIAGYAWSVESALALLP